MGNQAGTDEPRLLRQALAFLERFEDVPATAWGISTGTVTIFAGYYTLVNPGWSPKLSLIVLGGVVLVSIALAAAYTVVKPSRSERILRAQRAYDKGCTAFEDNRYPEALELFDAARRLDQRYAYESKYGRVSIRLGQYPNAVAAFTRAHGLASVKSERLASRRNRGIAFLITGQWGSALSDFNEYLESNKKSSIVLRHRALVHVQQGDFAKAESDARAAVKIAPTNSAPHSTLAVVLAGSGDPDGAARSMQKALQADPSSPAGRYAAAQALAVLGELDEAFRWLATVVQTDSRFSPRAKLDPFLNALRNNEARFRAATHVSEWKFLGTLDDDA